MKVDVMFSESVQSFPSNFSEVHTVGGGGIIVETDPTVPAWAKAPTKPAYTAEEVGADPVGSADAALNTAKEHTSVQVSTHNVATDTHNDIRLLISGLTERLNALANSDDTTLDQMAEVVAYIKDNRELIEQVTTGKVSVSDIIDNLTTNVANKPLSASQGVALKALIDAIKVPTKPSDIGMATESWTFTLVDGSTVTKAVYVG